MASPYAVASMTEEQMNLACTINKTARRVESHDAAAEYLRFVSGQEGATKRVRTTTRADATCVPYLLALAFDNEKPDPALMHSCAADFLRHNTALFIGGGCVYAGPTARMPKPHQAPASVVWWVHDPPNGQRNGHHHRWVGRLLAAHGWLVIIGRLGGVSRVPSVRVLPGCPFIQPVPQQ